MSKTSQNHRFPAQPLFSIWWLGISGVVVMACLLRIPLLGSSFWLDEAAQVLESARPLAQQLEIIPDFQPPLLHLVLHGALYLGSSEWWLRTVGALIPSLLTLVITMIIGQKIGGKRVAILTGILLATSSFHIFYSQELRPYALPALWASLSWAWLWFFLKKKKPSPLVPSQTHWIWYVLVTSLGLYSSYLYPFVVLGQLMYVSLWHRDSLGRYLLSLTIAGVCFAPWVPTFKQQLAAGSELRIALPGWSEVVSTPQLKALPLVAAKFVFGVSNLSLSLPFIFATSILIVTSGALLWGVRWWWKITPNVQRTPSVRILTYLGCWLIVPIFLAWVVSFFIPVVQPKRVLFALPAFYLAVTYVTNLVLLTRPPQVQRLFAPLLSGTLVLILLAINVLSTVTYWTQPSLQRENWRDIHHTIVSRYPQDKSVAIFAFDAPFAPWEWYDDGSYPTVSVVPQQITTPTALAEKLKTITEYQYVVLFDYLRDLTDPQHHLESYVVGLGYVPVEIIDQPNIGFVRVYAQPGARLSQN